MQVEGNPDNNLVLMIVDPIEGVAHALPVPQSVGNVPGVANLFKLSKVMSLLFCCVIMFLVNI